ncbi:hypothetical protein ACLOJK_031899 [Asimina triloba]
MSEEHSRKMISSLQTEPSKVFTDTQSSKKAKRKMGFLCLEENPDEMISIRPDSKPVNILKEERTRREMGSKKSSYESGYNENLSKFFENRTRVNATLRTHASFMTFARLSVRRVGKQLSVRRFPEDFQSPVLKEIRYGLGDYHPPQLSPVSLAVRGMPCAETDGRMHSHLHK